MTTNRTLAWPSCYNVRDLGGMPTVHGQATRMGAIVRSDLPARLTAQGQQALVAYGIRTMIDLRRPAQTTEEPAYVFTETAPHHQPIIHNISLENHSAAIDELIRLAGPRREEVYCLTVDHNQQQVAQIMHAIADAPPGGVLLHCSAGKDRTGIISALLLGLAEVPNDRIAADYALSQGQLWPLYEKLVDEAGGEDQVGWWLKPIATPAMMHHLLDHLQTRYGGVSAYLQQTGLTEQTLNTIRARLLYKAPGKAPLTTDH